ncbi:MAG: methyltransferase domain-containing protein [Steroidobacteraceae bacterium]
MKPIVSVVMICRDGERFLGDALESLRAQSLTGWELLFVDDGSVDGSAAIARDFGRCFPDQMTLLHHPGREWRGTGPSRNLGLAAARAPFVTFLDVDDVYERGRLERHVECLERNPGLGAVFSRDLYWHQWPGSGSNKPDYLIGLAADHGIPLPPPGLLVGTLLTRGAALPNPGSMTLRRNQLGADPIPPFFTSYYEDQALLARVLLSSWALVLPDCLLKYRQHASSLTMGNDPALEEHGMVADQQRQVFLRWLKTQLLEQPLDLTDLVTQVDLELANWESVAANTTQPARKLRRPRWVEAIRGRQRRRRVMAHVWRLGKPDARARSYWNSRVDDLETPPVDRASEAYFRHHATYRHAKASYLERVLGFDAWSGREVLELGCGIGLDIVRFASAGAEVTGVDLSEVALDLAQRNCQVSGVTARLLQADARQLPFRSESFDLVEAFALLPYVKDPGQLVSEVARVLRPGGVALFMAYHSRSWMSVLGAVSGGLGGHADAPYFRLYNRVELQRLLEPIGPVTLWTERFPGQGPASGLGSTLLGRAWQVLPSGAGKGLGWHLLAECRKVA